MPDGKLQADVARVSICKVTEKNPGYQGVRMNVLPHALSCKRSSHITQLKCGIR